MKRSSVLTSVLAGLACSYAAGALCAEHDIEFVAEHLPEVAMDNRFATLPVWAGSGQRPSANSYDIQAGYAGTSAGQLKIRGALLAAAFGHQFNDHWSARAFIFYDSLQLTGDHDDRPLQTLFSPSTPIERPVAASYSGLDGTATHYGVGIAAISSSSRGWLGEHRWVSGLLWQRIDLRDYRLDYRILAGPAAGASGQIDFDSAYAHITPFAGIELPRQRGRWAISPHALFAFPWPRRGIAGHITGPGFDLRGNTEDTGAGKHFGDPSLTLGLDLTYLPARLTLDVGTTITQRLLEPKIHDGIEQNWVISAQWRY